MDERQFYNEKPETKNITLTCPACRKEDSYPVRWIVRTKKNELPRGAGEEDKKRSPWRAPTWSAWMNWWHAANAESGLNLQGRAWC